MTDPIRFTDAVEWPLTEDGRQKLLSTPIRRDGTEGDDGKLMESPTVYDADVHHVDPASIPTLTRSQQLTETAEVVERVLRCRTGKAAPELPCFDPGAIMRHFGVTTAQQVAVSVRSDDPALHLTRVRQWLIDEVGAVPRLGLFSDLPQDWSNGPPAVAATMTMLPWRVSPTVFARKYFYGSARPAQIIDRALTGTIEVEPWFVRFLHANGIRSLQDFLEAAVGDHPWHPDDGAMHGGAVAAGDACSVLFVNRDGSNLADDVVAEIDAYQMDMGHGRDTLGVHTWTGTANGMETGRQAVRAVLPSVVGELGGNDGYAQAVIDRLSSAQVG